MSRLDEIRAQYGIRPISETPELLNRAALRTSGSLTPPTASDRLAEIRRTYGIESVRDDSNPLAEFVNQLPEPVRRTAGGAIRGLASALEPLQLPQDALFAALAGALDPNTTITQRFSQMNLADYMPGGEAPPRISNGEEIFTLMGLEGSAAKWAGIAADLTVDPLVFGSWLRLGGKLTGVSKLLELGDKVDDFLSPIGFGKVAVSAARRSPAMSSFMDARMAALEGVFRNPNSVVLGIQRFGERSTNVLEKVLPKSQVDRLRWGTEVAGELADARRKAASMGQVLNEEALTMIWRTGEGVADPAKDTVRTYLKTLGEQRLAYEARLEALDPTVRDVVERAVYDIVQPSGDKPGIGFLAFLGGRQGIQRIDDADTRVLTEDIYEALSSAVEGRASVRSGRVDIDNLLADLRSDDYFETLNGARNRISEVARERATTAGLGAEEVFQAQSRSVRAFNGYLADTLLVDAKLGMATSGYDFVSNQVRGRVFELTGNMNEAQQVWHRVLRTGLLGGQEAIEKLKTAPTNISLRNLLPSDRAAVAASTSRRIDYRTAVTDEVRALGRDVPQIRRDTFDRRMAEIKSESDDIWKSLYKRERVPDSLAPNPEQAAAIRKARAATEQAAINLRAAEEALESAKKFGFSGASEARYNTRLARFVSERNQAESALSGALSAERAVLSEADRIRGGMRVSVRPAGRSPSTRGVAMSRLSDLIADAERLETKLRNSRFARSRAIEEVVAARSRAQAATGIGPAGRAATAEDVAGTMNIGDIPMAGKNTGAEDILARRMHETGMTAEEAVKAPLTYGELIDGAMSFQALDLGDYLQGLMNGHLRRTYALFGDTDDFKKYIDGLRVGSIVPSRVIDEADLTRTMVGYENEAKLIMDYHALMSRQGRGVVLQKSRIAEYLINSKVPPERVNGALRSMAQAVGPENGPLADFLKIMDEMVPRYKSLARERQRALARSSDDPRVATGQRYFEERESLTQETLEQLGEIAMARASLVESTEIARRTVSRQEMIQNTYRVANTRGLIKSSAFTDEFGTRYVKFADAHESLGGFAGKYIHPYLYEELKRATTVKPNLVPQAMTRMRALITGGYLAAPSVIAANFFGGLYQAGTVGINPAAMLRRLVGVADEVNGASLGFRSPLIAEIRRNLNLEISGMNYQDVMKELKKVNLDDFGLGPQGINKVFDDVAGVYERFLQRPGIGRVRTRFAGLEGFQFTENWMKVAGYAEMKDRLLRRLGRTPSGTEMATIEKQAAEFARTIVFDYSELPTSLEFLKQTGLVLFPGFTYFLAGRTIDAAVRRPGALAVADRISEAVSNATLSTEEQIISHLGTPDWLKDDQGVPMPFTVRRGPQGEEMVNVLPLNQLVPTSTIWDGLGGAGNPWAESIASMGLWGPFMEVLMALVSGEGEAPLTARYGNRVFDADSEGPRKVADITRFLYNTLAPSNVKKLITVDMQGQLSGLGPSLTNGFRDMTQLATGGTMEAAYSFEESRTLRPDRGWRESLLSTFLRSPQVVALEGPLVGIGRELRNEQARLGEQLTMLRRRANRARSEGDEAAYERWVGEIRSRQEEFNATWAEYMAFYQNFASRRREESAR